MHIVLSPQEAVACISSGQRVFVHGGAATPLLLLDALYARAGELKDVELTHLHIMGDVPYSKKGFKESFKVANLFVGPNVRKTLDYDRIDYLPCFLSEIPQLFRSKQRPIDVALIHVSPPDQHGFCTLGTSVDVARAAVEMAHTVIALINLRMPRVHGDGFVHINKIDYAVEVDFPLPEDKPLPLTDIELKIGAHVAAQIEDGAALQIGIGAIPNAVLSQLGDRKHLGVHTELWSDPLLPLIYSGAVDNSQKTVHPGKIVSSFIIGTRALYDFIHDNPSVIQLDIGYINNPEVIARNAKTIAINSAVEIDLTGQVCADSVGPHIISGVGGQMDFMRGATLSKDGKAIIAMAGRTGKGVSKIVCSLKPGAGVVTTRAHVHYVATEYGIVDLHGKTLSERAQALISIAHPDDRENLAKEWHHVMA